MQLIPTRINFLKKYSKLTKYTLVIFVCCLLSISLFFSVVAPVIAATSVGISSTNIVPQGLVGYWTFDGKNMTNATATDISGQGNNGTLTNMTTRSSAVTGKMGQALIFNGSNTKINIGTSSSLNLTGDVSINSWIKPTTYGGGSRGRIVDNAGASPTSGYRFAIDNANVANGFGFGINVSGTLTVDYVVSNANVITLNKWQMVTVTFSDSTDTVKFYVDGVLQGTRTLTGSINSSGIPVFIGARSGADTANFDGTLDDVRIYNRALSPTEIKTLYKAGGGVLTSAPLSTSNAVGLNSGLVGYWTFDGKNMTNATATDMSGNGNNGTLTNMTRLTSAVSGKIGQALKFDGVDDEVVIQGSSLGSVPVTVSAWVYVKSFSETTLSATPANYGVTIFSTRNVDAERSPTLLVTPVSNGAGSQLALTFMEDSNALAFGAKGSSVIQTGKWYHVVGTFDNSGVATFGGNWNVYLNGVKDNTSANNFYFSGSHSAFTGTTWRTGNAAMWPGTSNVVLDDVRVYNRALSLNEIQALYKLGQTVTSVSSINNNSTGINSGLVGYWNFDGKYMTNTTALDASGNGLTGTLTNMTRSSSATIGKVGQGLKFNGSGQYIALGTPAALDLRTAHSISVWVKTSVLNTTQTILAAGTQGCCGTENLLSINYNGGGGTYKPQYFHSAYSTMDASSIYFKANTWYHIVVAWDGSGTQKMYINGVLNSTATLTGIGTFGNIANIGATDGGATSFNGVIDELRVYSREITPSEVQALYKLGGK